MKNLPENQCRRCGHSHEEVLQLVDPESRWAVTTAHCHCGHRWTTIHTAPVNLRALRVWVSLGCPEDAVRHTVAAGGWQTYRLEGVGPALLSTAS